MDPGRLKNILKGSGLLSKRNIIAFLFLGILSLSIPLGLQMVQKQQVLRSRAESVANTCKGPKSYTQLQLELRAAGWTGVIDPTNQASIDAAVAAYNNAACPVTVACTDHQPQSPSYYDTFDSPDRFGNTGWLPSVGHLHLNKMYAWNETDRNPDGSQINPSYKLTYREVINNPCFTYAVKTMDEFFSIPTLRTGSAGRTYCDEANYDPGLGRGDPRKFDPAERVSYYITAPRSHVDPPTGRQTSQTDNPAGDPVAWLVNNGYWANNIYYYDVNNQGKSKPSTCQALPGAAAPAKPTALTAVCSADNRTAALSWISEVSKFDLRVDGPATYPAQVNNCSPHSICLNDFTAKNITVNVSAGGTVSYWLNAKNAAGAPGETSDIKTFTCGSAVSASPTTAVTTTVTAAVTRAVTSTVSITVSVTGTPSAACVTGDIDGNSCIGIADLNRWKDLYLAHSYDTTADVFPVCRPDGSHGDRSVDLNDFNIWLIEYLAGRNRCSGG